MINMSVNIGALRMNNPVTVASGTFGSGKEYSDFFDLSRLGAVTTKGVSLNGWPGNETPRICETPSGMLNSIGLQNPGVEYLKSNDIVFINENNVPIIVNVSGHSIDEYVSVVEALEDSPVDAYEINVSCPNVDAGGMTLGTDPSSVEEVTKRIRAVTSRPVIVKLTPNVTDITEIALAAEAGGADGISLINTILGMSVDIKCRCPKLAKVMGGLSGPAIKPVALRMVWQCYNKVSIPIVGMGGICTAEDAIEFMLCGATAVAVGTANFMNPTATIEIIDGIEQYCTQNNIDRVTDLIGALEC